MRRSLFIVLLVMGALVYPFSATAAEAAAEWLLQHRHGASDGGLATRGGRGGVSHVGRADLHFQSANRSLLSDLHGHARHHHTFISRLVALLFQGAMMPPDEAARFGDDPEPAATKTTFQEFQDG